jgi:hypothetical protein
VGDGGRKRLEEEWESLRVLMDEVKSGGVAKRVGHALKHAPIKPEGDLTTT